MSSIAKFLGWLVAGLVALFAIAAVAFFFFFDANDFREEIGAAVQDATGRELVIEGDVAPEGIPVACCGCGQLKAG